MIAAWTAKRICRSDAVLNNAATVPQARIVAPAVTSDPTAFTRPISFVSAHTTRCTASNETTEIATAKSPPKPPSACNPGTPRTRISNMPSAATRTPAAIDDVSARKNTAAGSIKMAMSVTMVAAPASVVPAVASASGQGVKTDKGLIISVVPVAVLQRRVAVAETCGLRAPNKVLIADAQRFGPGRADRQSSEPVGANYLQRVPGSNPPERAATSSHGDAPPA